MESQNTNPGTYALNRNVFWQVIVKILAFGKKNLTQCDGNSDMDVMPGDYISFPCTANRGARKE